MLAQPGSRWQLRTLRAACPWLQPRSLSGVWRLLRRLGLRLKRGRAQVHSPDVNYLEKLRDILEALSAALNSEGREVVIFVDQCTFSRQPSLSRDWCWRGRREQPLARRSHRADTEGRIIGGLNALSGRCVTRLASRTGIESLVEFWQGLRAAYPAAECISVVLDNWPVHYHPDVLAALAPQRTRWELKTPPHWPRTPRATARRLGLPIQLLPLPTYASWCNPIEKLWRWLRQEVLHLHRAADDWVGLKAKVQAFLDRFSQGSAELLRYVGLTPKSKLFGALFAPQASPT